MNQGQSQQEPLIYDRQKLLYLLAQMMISIAESKTLGDFHNNYEKCAIALNDLGLHHKLLSIPPNRAADIFEPSLSEAEYRHRLSDFIK